MAHSYLFSKKWPEAVSLYARVVSHASSAITHLQELDSIESQVCTYYCLFAKEDALHKATIQGYFFINEQLSTVDDPIDIVIDELCNKTAVKLVWQGHNRNPFYRSPLCLVRLLQVSFHTDFYRQYVFLQQAINSLQELISQARGFKCSAHASHILGKC